MVGLYLNSVRSDKLLGDGVDGASVGSARHRTQHLARISANLICSLSKVS